jgi:DNA-directed RNA polymerase subunit RPC12/RpoP
MIYDKETVLFVRSNKKYRGKDIECPYCEYVSSRSGLVGHIKKDHPKKQNEILHLKKELDDNSKKDYITCPICRETLKDIARHLSLKHGIRDKDEFYINNPTTPLLIQNKPVNIKCSHCNEVFDNTRKYTNHLSKLHGITPIKKNGHYTCEICGKKYNDIKQHVQGTHLIDWNDYCSTYNVDLEKTKYISKDYIESLSNNKKMFYKTERGKELKKIQSKKWSENNPMTIESSRNKMMVTRSINNFNNPNFRKKSYGMKFTFTYNNEKYFTRSYTEYVSLLNLLVNHISFGYETKKVWYELNGKKHVYIADLIIGDTIYEIKSHESEKYLPKYDKVKAVLKGTQYSFEIVTPDELFSLLNIEKMDKENIYCISKKLLDNDNLKIQYRTYKNNSRILKDMLGDEYETYKNVDIKFINKEEA